MSNVLSFKLPTKKHKTNMDKPPVENPPATMEIQVMLCESCGGKTFLLSSQTTDIYCSGCLVPVYILQWGEK
mgnify:CR=1 FL=1